MNKTHEQLAEALRQSGLTVEEVDIKGFTMKMIKPAAQQVTHWKKHPLVVNAKRFTDEEIAAIEARVGRVS